MDTVGIDERIRTSRTIGSHLRPGHFYSLNPAFELEDRRWRKRIFVKGAWFVRCDKEGNLFFSLRKPGSTIAPEITAPGQGLSHRQDAETEVFVVDLLSGRNAELRVGC